MKETTGRAGAGRAPGRRIPRRNPEGVRVGARIRRLRLKLAVTQGELVRRTRLQASYLSKVENGIVTPGLANLDRIARALGLNLAYLVRSGPL